MVCRNCGGPHETQACCHPCTVCFVAGHTADVCEVSSSLGTTSTNLDHPQPKQFASVASRATSTPEPQILSPALSTKSAAEAVPAFSAFALDDKSSLSGTSLALNRLRQQETESPTTAPQHQQQDSFNSTQPLAAALPQLNQQYHQPVVHNPSPVATPINNMDAPQRSTIPHSDPYLMSSNNNNNNNMIQLPDSMQHTQQQPFATNPMPSSQHTDTSSQFHSMPVYRPPSSTSNFGSTTKPASTNMLSRAGSEPASLTEEFRFVPTTDLESPGTSQSTTTQASSVTDISADSDRSFTPLSGRSQQKSKATARAGGMLASIAELPEYFHNVITSQLKKDAPQESVDTGASNGVTKQMEYNPVVNVVAERSALLSVALPFLGANLGVLMLLFINHFWASAVPRFPFEVLLIVPVTLKIIACICSPRSLPEQVIVDGENVAIYVAIFNENIHVLTKTLASIHQQTYKSVALVVVIDHHAEGLQNVLELLEADIGDGRCNPTTGDLEYNGIYDESLPYTVIMKRHHSGRHGSDCVFLRHLYKHCENFKYFVTLDGDTALHPDAVSNLVTRMEADERNIACFGRVLVANEAKTIWTSTQALLEAFDFSVDKHFQTLKSVDLVTRIPGNFSCFRTDRIFSSKFDYWYLSLDSTSPKSYLWKPTNPFGKNLLLQEDRRRTSLLLQNRQEGERICFAKAAIAETYVPTSYTGVISKYRRRYVSTVANHVQMLASPRTWSKWAGAVSEMHSLICLLALPVLCVYSYSAIFHAFGNSTNAGLLMGLWLLLLSSTLLYMNGHARHVLYLLPLLVTAPVMFVYIPAYAVSSFTYASWGTRSENPGVHPKTATHVALTYLFTVIATIVMTLVLYCKDMGTKCYL